MNGSFEECVEIVDERPGKDAAYLLDNRKLRDELGWKDSIGLEQGIRETIDCVSNNFTELKKQPLEYIHKE